MISKVIFRLENTKLRNTLVPVKCGNRLYKSVGVVFVYCLYG